MIIGGQYYIINHVYLDKEKENIQKEIQAYYRAVKRNPQDETDLQKRETAMYEKHGIMVSRLDDLGNIKNMPNGDYYLEIMSKVKSGTTEVTRIQLNNLINAKKDVNALETILSYLSKVEDIEISYEGISIPKSSNHSVPIFLWVTMINEGFTAPYFYFESQKADMGNEQMKLKESEGKYQQNPGISPPLAFKVNPMYTLRAHSGIVTDMRLPNYSNQEEEQSLYNNQTFAENILKFQADYLTDRIKFSEEKWLQQELNIDGVRYIQFIRPITRNGQVTEFAFTLTSLQPLTKAADLMKDYYLYLFLISLALTTIFCIYYSRIITKPILRINQVTKKIIEFEFGEKIPVNSKNEIGVLSNNINQLSERLEDYIEKLHAANSKLMEDIEKEMNLEQVRKDFISGVSHELKTPLSVMQVSVSMLQDGIAPEKNEYYLQAIENEIAKVNVLVNEMLNLAKYESGIYQVEKEQINIKNLFTQVFNKLLFQIEKKGLKAFLQFEDATVNANSNLLEQVLVNLLTNAIRYTEPGHGLYRNHQKT
jgi:two-component system, OmpR family, sensor histidine kinase VanS